MKKPMLPYSEDGERAVLGAVLLDNAAWQEAAALSAGDFFLDSHRKIFSTLHHLCSQGAPADLVTLVEELGKRGELDAIGGAGYLSSLTDGLPKLSSVEHYCKIIRDKATLRRVIYKSQEIATHAQDGPEDIGEFLQWARESLSIPSTKGSGGPTPWAAAQDLAEFLSGEEGADFLEPLVLVRECLTEIFSPRGLGKSLWAIFIAIRQAKLGRRVMLVDRDNARHTVRERIRGFGASETLPGIRVISREKAPRLTDAAAWAQFPYADYDLVIVDSLNASAEGIGEQDSGKPSKALAPLLDVCHREGGPAVLLLDNTVRTGAHSRGSGVIEDRADIVYEVRDATEFTPTSKKPWWQELPPADAGSWGERAARRKGRKVFRLAFVATKFRVGEEPEPFIVEIDLTSQPWTVRDVTDAVDQAGKEARETRRREQEEAIERASKRLLHEIESRSTEAPCW